VLNANFVIVGSLIGAVGAFAYLIDTIRGRVKPNRVSFLLWSIAPFIAFAAEVKQGVGLASLMTFSTGFWPIMVFFASFVNKKARWEVTKFDLVCGFLSVIGLILWLITKVGNLAIIFSILADGLASVPTVVKAYKYPDTEIAWPWMATVVGIILTLLTLKEWTFAHYGFVVYILVINTVIYSLVQFRIGEKLGFKEKRRGR